MQTWRRNHAIVEQLNRSNDGVYFADNSTSDLTYDEYAQMFGILTPEQYGALVPEPDEDRLMELSSVPEPDDEDRLMELSSDESMRLQKDSYYKINWVEKGKVSPVKD